MSEGLDILKEIKDQIQSGDVDSDSLSDLYRGLSSIVKADASLAPQALEVCRTASRSNKNGRDSLETLYEELLSIAKTSPSLAPQVVQICLEDKSYGASSFESFQLLSHCLKHCLREDIGSVTEEQKQIVQAAWNMRFSTEQEPVLLLTIWKLSASRQQVFRLSSAV